MTCTLRTPHPAPQLRGLFAALTPDEITAVLRAAGQRLGGVLKLKNLSG